MANNIKVLLEGKKSKIERRNFILNESIKIKRTPALRGGYYVILTSDKSGDEGAKETAMMGAILKLKKTDNWPHRFEKPNYFRDNKTGIFGWGYFVSTEITDEKVQQILSNMKFLVAEYNKEKKHEVDAGVESLTLNQIEQINQVVQALEKSAEESTNAEAKNNLEKYLDDLQKAIESDEVFDFLIESFEKAKTFQKRNQGWKYSILNALIVITADPTAQIAGPTMYWEQRNYKIKQEFLKKGIMIIKPGNKSDITQKAKYVKDNPEALDAFKKEMGIKDTEEYSLEKNKYALAKFATEKKYIRGGAITFVRTMVYTDNMVEPIPGKEPIELGGVDFTDVNKETQENITPLFDAVLSVAGKEGIPITDSLKSDKTNVNNLSRVLYAIAIKKVVGKYGESNKNQESIDSTKVQAESVSHIIKKHYGIESESSKYNIASWGGDKEKIKKVANSVIKTADSIIDQIDGFLKDNKPSIAESHVRTAIRNIIFANLYL